MDMTKVYVITPKILIEGHEFNSSSLYVSAGSNGFFIWEMEKSGSLTQYIQLEVIYKRF